MDKSSVIFQAKFKKVELVLFRERHAKYGTDEWSVLTLESGAVISKKSWMSASMALRHFADKSRMLSEKHKVDYYEGVLLPILDDIFDRDAGFVLCKSSAVAHQFLSSS